MKKSKVTYGVMLLMTVILLGAPLLLHNQHVHMVIAWFFKALNRSEYRSAYMSVLGGLMGSWLAITGAIYVQRKAEENRLLSEEDKRRKKEMHSITMCRDFLQNEIRRNHVHMMSNDGKFLNAIIEGSNNYHFSLKENYKLSNWNAIKKVVLEDNFQCACTVMKIYKYYDFLSDFYGTCKEIKDVSQIDFSEYNSDFEEVTTFLGISG